ncbi:MAG: class I SAM-dependent methyltransferase [Luteolibacter sp.]|uniref:class I SAM-dependent methyltransferase n=1 Tax=Luteolibacter sp. TaxID=1962973 RepID=UPI0032676859
MKENLELEAEAFDHQIIERVQNGHVPDLRYCTPCDYFYNNSWRRPEYVALDMGEQFARIHASLTISFGIRPLRILEVGCGPGFISLELSRAGHSVVGMDLSPECIRVAEQVADKDPHIGERGDLKYIVGDFFSNDHVTTSTFDAVVFVGALHHFKDQDQVMRRVHELLVPSGIVIAHEPTRDRVSISNASIVHLLTRLLSAGGGYFDAQPLPQNSEQLKNEVNLILNKLRYESENGEKLQSVNDNDAGHPEMTGALRSRFSEIEYDEVSGFYHEVIGGLRFPETLNAEVAKYIREMDRLMCGCGVVNSTEFYFVGKK